MVPRVVLSELASAALTPTVVVSHRVLSSYFLLPHLEDLQRVFPGMQTPLVALALCHHLLSCCHCFADASIVWVHRSPDEVRVRTLRAAVHHLTAGSP